ncbi:hypothetical protein SNOG_07981 [Parastagonospora nodorum SN15]|uniref:Uncharacterized protein n=1 Tax=Phaeosphaeria nodorum (strain SN15 / ATCC MYA-4574 / FGSC 10173) TaxID=321614 RepID=Q0UJT3_PHANO|nr:hypothetical protein SNOG_07981 [Parastagonospora nodorum SN15]EAT84257.1 hypothetical protein SNOG_07981 [Parastagonospora nodorum SN15]
MAPSTRGKELPPNSSDYNLAQQLSFLRSARSLLHNPEAKLLPIHTLLRILRERDDAKDILTIQLFDMRARNAFFNTFVVGSQTQPSSLCKGLELHWFSEFLVP